MAKLSTFFFIMLFMLAGCTPTEIATIEKKYSNFLSLFKSTHSNSNSLDFKIGQMIMMGINDRKVLDDADPFVEELQQGKTGGVLLYENNINSTNSKETLKKLIADMQRHVDTPLLVGIDEEGGKVHRLKAKYGFVDMPSAAYLGSLNKLDSTLHYAERLAALLSELGINVNFAPDVDVALNAMNPVISKVDRSYSADAYIVSKHALATISGHHKHGVKTAIKHFPGHGSSASDSHYGITDVTKQWQEIELIPYQEIIKSGQCDAVVTAHIVNCNLDSMCLPATLSKAIVEGLLRTKLEFKGVVFSDVMQMHAISKYYGLENAIKLSILAGVDVLVFGNNVHEADKTTATAVHAIIKKLVDSGEISEARIQESFERIMKFKNIKVGN